MFWDCADVEVEGDPDLPAGGALRAVSRPAGQRARRTPSHTGKGPDRHRIRRACLLGHRGFVLPVLTYTAPMRPPMRCAGGPRRWTSPGSGPRSSTSPAPASRGAPSTARSVRRTGPRAPRRGTSMLTSPWRSSAIALSRAMIRWKRSADSAVLVETARLWLSLGHHDRHGVWHLDGVTGPDEYTAIVRDNVFTNLMAVHNLQTAADACERHPESGQRDGGDHRRDGRVAGRGRCRQHSLRRGAGRPRAVRRVHHPA